MVKGIISDIISCMTEAELDTIEIRLRRKMEDMLSEGKIVEAENIEEAIKSLDDVSLCADINRVKWTKKDQEKFEYYTSH